MTMRNTQILSVILSMKPVEARLQEAPLPFTADDLQATLCACLAAENKMGPSNVSQVS